ncbi:hypothetical protein RJ640_020881 [Escallonia rubra]|uniref:TLDc domain-containing protein n=1 Tax=Escallonia rubra TaxID=112253 RepID=A0AA88U5L9_9ASTE|nr:hypothetical protein RJ640_020881 [Escallonia rubra]
MGASSSTEQVPADQREAETLAASTGALPMLQNAFAKLSDPETKAIPVDSLQQCFTLSFDDPIGEAGTVPSYFPALLNHLGPSIVDLFFLAEKGGVSWIEFLRGYTKCCGRTSASNSFKNLFKVFQLTAVKAGLPEKLQFESDDSDGKVNGSLLPADLLMLLWMCWVMSWDSRNLSSSKGQADNVLPDLNHLVLSAVVSCTDGGADLGVYDSDVTGLDVQLPAGKLQLWALKMIQNLPDCFTQHVHARLRNSVTREDKSETTSSSVHDTPSTTECSTHLLTCGRAWAISLTLRSTVREEILKICFASHVDEKIGNLLYRSSLHGKGLNRFWSNVEGYNGPLLLVIAASSGDAHEGNKDVKRWIIGALTHQGFENKDTFYGTSGCLYALSPVFHVLPSSGKEKNFVYSHLHPTGRVYESHPKPLGVAFGGSIGNERIFVDEDFSKLTVRHHAFDKSYVPGSLFPNQGFLPLEALILEVEAWGLGGTTAKKVQTSYKKREELFTVQRRKVDLKTFANWEDSPEKTMMDMVSDPNSARREDR